MLGLKYKGKFIDESHALELARWKDSDPKAREDLILYLMPLVDHVVAGTLHVRRGDQLDEDCRLEGMIGLISAIDSFDPKRSKYIIAYIRIALMRRLLRAIGKMPCFTMSLLANHRLRALRKLVLTFKRIHRRWPLTRDLLPLGPEANRLRPRLEYVLRECADVPPQAVGRENFIPTNETQRELLLEKELLEYIEAFGKTLDPRRRRIFQNALDLDGGAITQTELARECGISRARISDLEIKVLEKFRGRFQILLEGRI